MVIFNIFEKPYNRNLENKKQLVTCSWSDQSKRKFYDIVTSLAYLSLPYWVTPTLNTTTLQIVGLLVSLAYNKKNIHNNSIVTNSLVRDSSAVRQLFVRLAGAVGSQCALHKEYSGFAAATLRRHISTFRGYQIFIFYPKPLYKSLHQSFFYSFITILPSESGVTLHYSTILPQIL